MSVSSKLAIKKLHNQDINLTNIVKTDIENIDIEKNACNYSDHTIKVQTLFYKYICFYISLYFYYFSISIMIYNNILLKLNFNNISLN